MQTTKHLATTHKKVLMAMFVLTLSCLVLIGARQDKTYALSPSDFNPGRIIDDSIFYDPLSMSADQIQQFLNAKVPVCDTNGTKSYNGSQTRAEWAAANGKPLPPYTCLKDYSQSITGIVNSGSDLCGGNITGGTKTAAQLIYEVGVACGVNPKVLIVLLQKEQSLVTDDWPWPTQYQTATGYGCPDTAPCDSEYYGFFSQIYQAAMAYKRYRANPTNYNYKAGRDNIVLWNPNAACGTSTFYIDNQATAGLYIYTPYRPNDGSLAFKLSGGRFYSTAYPDCGAYGNLNFWLYFNNWFGTTLSDSAPSPLYQSVGDGRIYAVWGDSKYYIPNWDTMIAWGFHKMLVTLMPADFLDGKDDGGTLGTTIKSDITSDILYLLDDGKRYPVSYSACKKTPEGVAKTTYSWGIDCFNTGVVKTYPEAFLHSYTTQDITLPEMIAFQDSVWKLEQGKKRRIVDSLVVDVLGGWSKVRWMKDLNAGQPTGKMLMRNGFLVRFSGSSQLYLYDNGALNPVPDPDMMFAWGMQKVKINDFPASYNSADPLPLGIAVSRLAKNTENGKYYIIDNGFRMAIGNATAQWPTASVVNVSSGYLNKLQEIPLSDIYKSDYGAMFTVFGSKRFYFATDDDFRSLGFDFSKVRRLSYPVEALAGLGYGGKHLANGRLYKINGNIHQIFLVNGSSSLLVQSTNYPGLPYDKIITVDQVTADRYPLAGVYSP